MKKSDLLQIWKTEGSPGHLLSFLSAHSSTDVKKIHKYGKYSIWHIRFRNSSDLLSDTRSVYVIERARTTFHCVSTAWAPFLIYSWPSSWPLKYLFTSTKHKTFWPQSVVGLHSSLGFKSFSLHLQFEDARCAPSLLSGGCHTTLRDPTENCWHAHTLCTPLIRQPICCPERVHLGTLIISVIGSVLWSQNGQPAAATGSPSTVSVLIVFTAFRGGTADSYHRSSGPRGQLKAICHLKPLSLGTKRRFTTRVRSRLPWPVRRH